MEEYRSGHNGTVSKTVCFARGTWVRIPPPPQIFEKGFGAKNMVGAKRRLF